MRLCGHCWKNMKLEPGAYLVNENNKYPILLCKKCIESDLVQKMVKKENYKLIYNAPGLEEMERIKNESNNV